MTDRSILNEQNVQILIGGGSPKWKWLVSFLKEVKEKLEDLFDYDLSQELDGAGDTVYCLYQLDGNNLYPSCDSSSTLSTSSVDTDNASNTYVKQ